ncbi:hypothetical protein [Nocardia crassostreae]|uniref:hypothetical protein n=1 Tax=Nocardia crassostreae TaxID=53428 RepID=UPI00082E7236|nr:hypothetical protein [Nocardia crassostreae]
MADLSFPAHLTVKREPDIDGLPILTAQVDLDDDVVRLPLPEGPAGPQGQQGRPRATFRKTGEIANTAARPTGLGADDRGKWWHRLDDNGMDVWTGAGWQHSPNAVGPKGPVAEANSITDIETIRKENLTVPAVEFVGSGPQQQLKVTVPAGLRGPKGPAGESGTITEADDYDKISQPIRDGVFSYHRASGKFRSAPPPYGTGPWSWYSTDFIADTAATVPRIIAGTFTIPAQDFAWRPIVHGHLAQVTNDKSRTVGVYSTVRLHSADGVIVAASSVTADGWTLMPLIPSYREGDTTKTLSPTSTFATVPAGRAVNFVVAVERYGSANVEIGFGQAHASLVVNAQPIG